MRWRAGSDRCQAVVPADVKGSIIAAAGSTRDGSLTNRVSALPPNQRGRPRKCHGPCTADKQRMELMDGRRSRAGAAAAWAFGAGYLDGSVYVR